MEKVLSRGCIRNCEAEQGFTLIDLAVWLIVIGLLGSAFLVQYNQYIRGKARGDTVTNLSVVNRAIENFYFSNGHYPCPADITLSIEDDDYGLGVCDDTNPIMIGGVPFKDIQLPAERTLDGWKNKFTYTVTTELAYRSTFDGAAGRLTFRSVPIDADGTIFFNSAQTDSTTGHFALVSHGDNGAGAFTAAGVLSAPCPDATIFIREGLNCNGGTVFFSQRAAQDNRFVGRSLTQGTPLYLDDILHLTASVPTRVWIERDSTSDVVSQNILFGIGTDFPEAELDVTGNILTDGGRVFTPQVCVGDTGDCFTPDIIAGSRPNCVTRGFMAMRGIRQNEHDCAPPPPTTLSGSCGTGQYVIGVNANGSVRCGS